MKVDGQSRRAHRVIKANEDLRLHVPRGGLIHLVKIGGRTRVMVERAENATSEGWEELGRLAAVWQERLRILQGPAASANRFMELLSEEQKRRGDYVGLRQEIADTLARYLRRWAKNTTDSRLERASREADDLEQAGRTSGTVSRPLLIFHEVLSALGLSDEEIEAWAIQGLERISRGEPAFGPDEPFSRDDLIEALKTYRRGKGRGRRRKRRNALLELADGQATHS